MNTFDRLRENLAQVRGRVREAAIRGDRTERDVRLVAVTKYVQADLARALVELGCLDLGESRPQELWRKAGDLAGLSVRWHLIGHLQRNKAARTLPLVALVHSVDSIGLLETLHGSLAVTRPRLDILVEVNVSGDPAKHGVSAAEVEPFLATASKFTRLQVRGLMTMGRDASDPDETRRIFRDLRLLRDRLHANLPPGVALDELSMGMSGDYEIAIEEGATMVRVGAALFAGIEH